MADYEAIVAFRKAIEASGLAPPRDIVPDGKIHRFASNCDARDDAGWYVFYPGGAVPAGAFGCWRAGVKQNWHAEIDRPLTAAESQALQERIADANRQRAEDLRVRQDQAAERALAEWEQATKAPADHPYLQRKGIRPHTLRVVADGRLAVPLYKGGKIRSLQFISADSEKRFLPGGEVKGCYFPIGRLAEVSKYSAIAIAEGLATGASIYEATGMPTITALGAGNLLPVAETMREKYPAIRMIIAADDDYMTEGNPGLTKARAAAAAVNGFVAVPDFGQERPEGAKDFNDLARHMGVDTVKQCILAALPAPQDESGEARTETTEPAHTVADEPPKAEAPKLGPKTLNTEMPTSPAPLDAPGTADGKESIPPEDTSWPDPVNVFAELTAPPFEASDLPPELGAYPALYARQTGIDASIALTAAVVVAAAAISDRIQVCADSSSRWFAQSRLWRLVIGAPGAGKSPADREMQSPLWALHSEADEAWRAAVKVLPEDEPKPPRPRVIVGDATLEALSDVLAENPRGVLVSVDEFDAWLGAMDQYRSSGIGRDRGEWLSLFDGGPHSIERVKRGTVFVENWGVSILTATTPAAMRRLTRHLPEDGLIQRFIVVLARRQRIVCDKPERPEIETEQARYTETIRRLWFLQARAHKGIVPLSFGAQERFTAWRAENATLQEALGSLDPALEAHVAKYPTLALRLALTFHCVRIANLSDPLARDPAAFPIPAETLETALAFLRRASQHALALYLGRKGGSQAYEIARDVARFVLSRSPAENAAGLQRRDLLRRVFAFRDAEEGAQGAAIRLLTDLGWLCESTDGYQKAQPTRFSINPGLHQRFAAIAEQERERRALVRERITDAAERRREQAANA